jgi:hypothetical protein
VTVSGGGAEPCTSCTQYTGTLSGTGNVDVHPNGTYYVDSEVQTRRTGGIPACRGSVAATIHALDVNPTTAAIAKNSVITIDFERTVRTESVILIKMSAAA